VPDRRVSLGALRDDVTVKAGSKEAQRVQNPIGIGGNLVAVFMDLGLLENCGSARLSNEENSTFAKLVQNKTSSGQNFAEFFDAKVKASFREAVRIAREQKSVSLEKRAEATYAEYRRQKASGSGGRGFRLPLC
jgi:hypothetical protein